MHLLRLPVMSWMISRTELFKLPVVEGGGPMWKVRRAAVFNVKAVEAQPLATLVVPEV